MALLLDDRLMTAASFVREGARFADIGSDHAYLPIFLCREGKISAALASDINRGPIMSAKENIKQYGLSDKIQTVCADGLSASAEFMPDDIAILGMGGELIISILEAAPQTKNDKIRLILQPMTHAELLYIYLLSQGYEIVGEKLCCTDGKRDDRIYRVICAEYCGEARSVNLPEALVGEKILADYKSGKCPLAEKYIKRIISVYRVRMDGKRSAGSDFSEEENVISALEDMLD